MKNLQNAAPIKSHFLQKATICIALLSLGTQTFANQKTHKTLAGGGG